MSSRTGPSDTANRVQTSTVGRGTIREIDDDHLCQECKTGDTGFSRTHTSFEMWTPIGMTATPVKQKEDKQKKGGGKQDNQDWNKEQPQGEASEMLVNYVGGSAAHPVGMASDRRARPYGLKDGEAAMYSADGSGQMMYHRTRGDANDGLYILTCDDQEGEQTLLTEAHAEARRARGENAEQQQKRFVSIRHVVKPKQRRKKEKKQGAQALAEGGGEGGGQDSGELPDGSKSDYKHEGKEVNTEQRMTDQQIQYYDGGTAVGHYDRGKKDWLHHDGKKPHSTRADKDHTHIMHEKENVVWVNKDGLWSSKPIMIKPDECDV